MTTTDSLPLSYINQFDYCARRFWYIYAQGEMKENVHVLRGTLNHERVNTPGYESTSEGLTLYRRVTVRSERLNLSGICDLVEEDAIGKLTPVEYKQGQQGKWGNDEAQLCAQALCLEEMTGKRIDDGAIFYFGSRRRLPVTFSPELRQHTEHLIQQMAQVIALGEIPAHTHQRQRCNGCSLVDVCLPKETDKMRQS
ncbi:MAG: CRISPR-associated protein Cas4 [Caldilineaceae bacterium]